MIKPTHYDAFKPRLTVYIPHKPTPKQRAFLWLPHEEAFYGGAAGGGKSDALLMGGLQYVDIPNYAGLILRKTLADADKPGSILARARGWLAGTDAVFRNNCWYFPSGARLQFGKLGQVGDRESFQSDEYQYIAGDEITQFYEDDFDYVTSRLRSAHCPYHSKNNFSDSCQSCAEYAALSRVPKRIRGASNPGGKGHIWVKRRYDIRKVLGKKTPNGRQLYAGQHPDRPHVPAFIDDNPFLDDDYLSRLSKMTDPVTREQLLSGDWGVSEEGRFKPSWLKRFTQKGQYVEVDGATWRESELETFIMIDPAASKKATPGSKEITKKIASYTASGVFSFTPDGHILVRRVDRHQEEVPATKHMINKQLQLYSLTQFVGMELTTMSTHLYQVLSAEGLNMKALKPKGQDKIARSVSASNEMESGRIFVPDEPSHWLQDFEDEIFIWTGADEEVDDQVDILSYAAIYKRERYIGSRNYDVPSVV